MSSRRLVPLVFATLLVASSAALAGTVRDEPDNTVTDAVGATGLNPCGRADLVEATFRPDGEFGTVWVTLADLGAACFPTTSEMSSEIHYRVDYVTADGDEWSVKLDTRWREGSLLDATLFTLVSSGSSAGGSTVPDAEELVNVGNDTVELPASGQVPLEEVVFRTDADTDSVTADHVSYNLQVDRMPNVGGTTFGD